MKIICITPIKHLKGLYEELCSYVDVIYKPYILKNDLKKILKKDKKIQGIFCNPNKMTYKLDEELLKNTCVKIINTASTGLNHLDLDVCNNLDIQVLSLTKDLKLIKQLPSTAELAFGLMISLLRNIPKSFDAVKNGEWDYEKFIGRQVRGLTTGIIGYGRLGSLMAQYCNAFGMKVLIYDPYKKVKKKHYSQVNLQKLIKNSDVISLHVHVTKDTIQMINSKLLKQVKNGCYLINTSRGEIVDEKALLIALKNKKIAGYGTDVLVDEFGNVQKSPLIKAAQQRKNIIITPHIGGMTWEGQQLAFSYAIKKFQNID